MTEKILVCEICKKSIPIGKDYVCDTCEKHVCHNCVDLRASWVANGKRIYHVCKECGKDSIPF